MMCRAASEASRAATMLSNLEARLQQVGRCGGLPTLSPCGPAKGVAMRVAAEALIAQAMHVQPCGNHRTPRAHPAHVAPTTHFGHAWTALWLSPPTPHAWTALHTGRGGQRGLEPQPGPGAAKGCHGQQGVAHARGRRHSRGGQQRRGRGGRSGGSGLGEQAARAMACGHQVWGCEPGGGGGAAVVLYRRLRFPARVPVACMHAPALTKRT